MKQGAILQLLALMREETDSQHRLTQQQLRDRMEARFGVTLNRRTLKSYLDTLTEAGYPLNSTALGRHEDDGSGRALQTDWYLDPDFEGSELRLLCDLLASAPAIPAQQRKEILQKLCRHGGVAQQTQTAAPVSMHRPANPQLLYTVEQLCDAMSRDRMVQFRYCRVSADENMQPQLVPRTGADGTPKQYLVSPQEIAIAHGRYYLLGRTESHEGLTCFRIDRITECRLMEYRPRRQAAVILPEHPAEYLYMYTGEQVECRFRIDTAHIGDVTDWFGKGAVFSPSAREGFLEVTVHVHPTAMQHWALQYGKYVEVLSPDSLRAAIAETVRSLAERYK